MLGTNMLKSAARHVLNVFVAALLMSGAASANSFNIAGPTGDVIDPVVGQLFTVDLITSEPGKVTDLNVSIEIVPTNCCFGFNDNPWDDFVYSISHGGVTVILHDNPGAAGPNQDVIFDMTFDDEAATTLDDLIAGVTTPPLPNAIGEFRPDANSLSAFDGMDLAGTWTVGFLETCCAGESKLQSFSISGTVEPTGPVEPTVISLYGVASGFGTGEQGSGGGGGGTGPGQFSQFHIIDLDTGIATEISMDIGFGGDVSAVAIGPGGVVFSTTGGRGPNTLGRGVSPTEFFTIDPLNGLGSVAIGPMGIEFGPPQSEGDGPGAGDFDQFGSLRQNASDMSFNPIDGVLYGMTGRGSQLFTVDTATGLATRIGTPCPADSFGNATNCRRGNAIAFNPLGTLFSANDVEVAELNPSTGLIVGAPVDLDFTPFGPPDEPNAGFRVVGMDYHPLTGDLYASVLQRQSASIPAPRATLAILDPLMGTFDIIGQVDSTGVKLEGIAFTPASDHFRCYAVEDVSVQDKFPVSLDDQFMSDSEVSVKKAVSICAPVNKNGEGIVDPNTHVVCYKISKSGDLNIGITVSNQFGKDQELLVLNQKTLCVPSSKKID